MKNTPTAYLKTPLTKDTIAKLKAGDEVLLSGIIYTARDQAHKRIFELLKGKKKLPFVLKDGVMYYCGPTKTPPKKKIGSCGPTTSMRMDPFTPALLKKGLSAMIGKGARSKKTKDAIKKSSAVYFIAPSGCGALLSKAVIAKKVVAFEDLGPEAIFKLEVENFPLIVGIDSRGKDIYSRLEDRKEST